MNYSKELQALHQSGRFRQREVYPNHLIDLASNDYLGLAEYKPSLERAYARLHELPVHAPKASMLINGYHSIHQELEEALTQANGFEKGILFGSGFLANLALIESLPRHRDILIMDESYHASGQLASKYIQSPVLWMKHNDPEHLHYLLHHHPHQRAVVAIEAIHSMHGDLAPQELVDVADSHEAILIVDEAHSSGVIGDKLLGFFDHYGITPGPNHIKMGTLGKAHGSFGAYVLCSANIASYLENRAKPLIYATALSLFDTALALENFLHANSHLGEYKTKIKTLQNLASDFWKRDISSLILPIEVISSKQTLEIQQILKQEGYLIGAIRPPTVSHPILRINLRTSVSPKQTQRVFELLSDHL